jgi:hypothetical protein
VFLGLRWPEPEGLRFRRMPSIAASTQAESCVSVKQKAPGQDGGDGLGLSYEHVQAGWVHLAYLFRPNAQRMSIAPPALALRGVW